MNVQARRAVVSVICRCVVVLSIQQSLRIRLQGSILPRERQLGILSRHFSRTRFCFELVPNSCRSILQLLLKFLSSSKQSLSRYEQPVDLDRRRFPKAVLSAQQLPYVFEDPWRAVTGFSTLAFLPRSHQYDIQDSRLCRTPQTSPSGTKLAIDLRQSRHPVQ
jgi:hypothetical protein